MPKSKFTWAITALIVILCMVAAINFLHLVAMVLGLARGDWDYAIVKLAVAGGFLAVTHAITMLRMAIVEAQSKLAGSNNAA